MTTVRSTLNTPDRVPESGVRWIPLAAACLVTPVFAAPAPKTTWADWVGDHDAKLVWTNCTTPGAKTATIAVDAVDGALTIDLARAGGGLRALPLVEDDDATWSAQQGDVSVTLKRAAGKLDLRVELESGCRVTGQLVRPSTNVAACDRLVAWTRVEAQCTKLHDAPLENPAALAKTKWKPGDADRGTTRAAKLELSLVDAGCAPHPDPLIGVRAPECQALATAAAKLSRCGNVPPDLKSYLVTKSQGLAGAAQTADRATLPVVETECHGMGTVLSSVGVKFNCPL
jgi:hypothetical protein